MDIGTCRRIVGDFVMTKSGSASGERLHQALENTPFQEDLDFLDKDTDEGMFLVSSMKYMCNSGAMVPVMKVICTDVIHPLVCRIRVLESALGNVGNPEKEGEK